MLFLAFLPLIIRLMCYLSGYSSANAIDFGVVKRYFYFLVSPRESKGISIWKVLCFLYILP